MEWHCLQSAGSIPATTLYCARQFSRNLFYEYMSNNKRTFADQMDHLDVVWESLNLHSNHVELEDKREGELHRMVLEESATYYGWDNFKQYQTRKCRQARSLLDQVYHMSTNEKRDQIRSIRKVKTIEQEVGLIKL